jgi:hypothetical protein
MWTLAFGHHEDRSPTHGYAETREALWRRSPRAGGGSEITRRERMTGGRLGKMLHLFGNFFPFCFEERSRSCVRCWPDATIILRQGARVVQDSRRLRVV